MSVSLIFDIIIVVICLFIIIKNAVRGFIKSFMALAKTVLAILIAYLFNFPIAKLFSGLLFDDLSQKWVRNLLLSTDVGNGEYAIYQIFDGIPDWFIKYTSKIGIDESIVNDYFVEAKNAPIEVVDSIALELGNALSLLISTVIAFIILFVVTEILLIVIEKLLGKIGKLPFLRLVNITLGAAIGAIFSIVIAWLISLLIINVFKFGANYYPEIFDHAVIEKSVIVKFFEEHNLFYIVKDYLGK